MELKLIEEIYIITREYGFNRTFMELKYGFSLTPMEVVRVLIVPLWN